MERLKSTEIKKQIKQKLGIAPSRYSLRWEPCTYSRSLECRVTDPTLGLSELDQFLSSFESIRYCEYSGEILSGGNRYVSVRYKWDLLSYRLRDLLHQELRQEFRDFLNSPANIWGASCWNPFCPSELYDAFIKQASGIKRGISMTEEIHVHPDFLKEFFGTPHICDADVKAFFQAKAA